MGYKERLSEALKRKAAAALSKDDAAEMQGREEAERAEEEAREAEATKIKLSMDRRVEALSEGGKPYKGVQVKSAGMAFIVSDPGAAAYNAWEKGVSASVIASVTGDTKTDRPTVSRTLALASVEAWCTGIDSKGEPVWVADFSSATENGARLGEFFKSNPAIVQDVVNAAVEVAKEAAAARKSGP
jgi:hypothetical protein